VWGVGDLIRVDSFVRIYIEIYGFTQAFKYSFFQDEHQRRFLIERGALHFKLSIVHNRLWGNFLFQVCHEGKLAKFFLKLLLRLFELPLVHLFLDAVASFDKIIPLGVSGSAHTLLHVEYKTRQWQCGSVTLSCVLHWLQNCDDFGKN